MIMAVSYYFDKTEYASRGDIDFDTTMYVAGGIVVWDLANQNWVYVCLFVCMRACVLLLVST